MLKMCIFLPLALLLFLFSLLWVPVDYIFYKSTPYAKETKRRYRYFATQEIAVKIYNKMRKDGVDFTYYKQAEKEYFLKESELLYPDAGATRFVYENGTWLYETEIGTESVPEKGDDPEDTELISLTEAKERLRMELSEEHRTLPLRFLVTSLPEGAPLTDDFYVFPLKKPKSKQTDAKKQE